MTRAKEQNQPKSKTELLIRLGNLDEVKLTSMVVERVWERLYEFADKAIQDEFKARLGEYAYQRIDAVGQEEIRKRVVEALETGFRRTNSFGEPTGETITLKERLAAMLSKAESSGYRETQTVVDRITREEIEKALRGAFATEISNAAKAFRAKVDAVLTGKLTEALKQAMGLR
jgi:hypothetical protein